MTTLTNHKAIMMPAITIAALSKKPKHPPKISPAYLRPPNKIIIRRKPPIKDIIVNFLS